MNGQKICKRSANLIWILIRGAGTDQQRNNWLSKHMKKVRSSQSCISINICTELRKTQFFSVITKTTDESQTSHRRVTDESQTSTDESQMTTDESQTSYRRLHTSHRRVTEDYRRLTDKSQTSHRQLKTNLRRMQLNHRLLQATGITKCIFSRWHSLINLFADLLILVTMKNDLYMKL